MMKSFLLTLLFAMLMGSCSNNGAGDSGEDTATDDTDPATGTDGDSDTDTDTDTDTDSDSTAVADPGLLQIDDLVYEGAFRVAFGNEVSDTNYAVGTLAFNPENHSLFLVGHAHHNAIAEFAIPTPDTAGDAASLTAVTATLQPFTLVLDAAPDGNPENIDRITGMLWVDGQLLVNAELWYDAGGTARDTTLAVRDADVLGGLVDGYFELDGAAQAGGYMAPIPPEWQEALGGQYLTGWASNYSIISRYSVGPSLFVFSHETILDAAPGTLGPVSTTTFMTFPHADGHYMGEDALMTTEGSAPALWNFLSRGVYGMIVPGTRTFAVFGSSGGVDSGIGYKITQDDGNLCGGYCAYRADDQYNYYWFFDVDDILAATDPWTPRPYAFGRWSVPFDDNGRHAIIGGTFDMDSGTLYLALSEAGQVEEYDRPPVIVVYSLTP